MSSPGRSASLDRRVRCPLCGSEDTASWRSVISAFRRCSCGLVINCGVPEESYDLDYFTGSDGDPDHRDFDSGLANRYDDARFDPELELLGRPAPGDRLLDVGSATGTFLERARSAGWEVLGVEISEAARAIAATKSIESVPDISTATAHGPFAVITLHHVVEHLDEPVEVLRELGQLLAVDGRLLIEVPNFASWDRRAARSEWLDLRPNQHLWQFSPGTLARLVRSAGFQVATRRTLGEPIPTRRSVAQSLGVRLPVRSQDATAGSGMRKVDVDDYVPSRLTATSARLADRITALARAGKRLQLVARRG